MNQCAIGKVHSDAYALCIEPRCGIHVCAISHGYAIYQSIGCCRVILEYESVGVPRSDEMPENGVINDGFHVIVLLAYCVFRDVVCCIPNIYSRGLMARSQQHYSYYVYQSFHAAKVHIKKHPSEGSGGHCMKYIRCCMKCVPRCGFVPQNALGRRAVIAYGTLYGSCISRFGHRMSRDVSSCRHRCDTSRRQYRRQAGWPRSLRASPGWR